MVLDLKRRRFTADEYERMASAGILGEDDQLELIDGEIVEMRRKLAAADLLPGWLGPGQRPQKASPGQGDPGPCAPDSRG